MFYKNSFVIVALVLLLHVFSSYPVRAAEDSKEKASQELSQLVSEISDALVKVDIAKLEQLWTDDFTNVLKILHWR